LKNSELEDEEKRSIIMIINLFGAFLGA